MLNDKRLIEDFLPIREISLGEISEAGTSPPCISGGDQNQSLEGLVKGSNELKILQKTFRKEHR